jgi:uracil-DNA glycosylase
VGPRGLARRTRSAGRLDAAAMNPLDPASLQVLISRLTGIAEEMGAVLRRAAYSPNIKERADCSAALFTAAGELLVQAEHIRAVEQIERIVRQHLETSVFLGVDFVPVRMEAVGGDENDVIKDEVEDEDAQEAKVKQSVNVESGERASPQAAAAGSAQKAAALAELRDRHDQTCPHCTIATEHTQTVFGEGHPDADLMFVGEAPGEEEDRTGRPFVGRAGQKLDQIIEAMGLKREDVYIANVLKSRPPNNRAPLKPEVDGCGPFLAEQIRIIQPKVIVTLGGHATKLMLDTELGITRLRGQWSEYVDATANLVVPVMPTFHPAYLLRNYTQETRKQIWSDMQAVMRRLVGEGVV